MENQILIVLCIIIILTLFVKFGTSKSDYNPTTDPDGSNFAVYYNLGYDVSTLGGVAVDWTSTNNGTYYKTAASTMWTKSREEVNYTIWTAASLSLNDGSTISNPSMTVWGFHKELSTSGGGRLYYILNTISTSDVSGIQAGSAGSLTSTIAEYTDPITNTVYEIPQYVICQKSSVTPVLSCNANATLTPQGSDGSGGGCACNAGYYGNGYTCVLCGVGSYCTGGTNATNCPSDSARGGANIQTTVGQGSTTQNACYNSCSAGTGGYTAATQSGGSTTTSSSCTCGTGSYTSTSGALCTACSVGTYQGYAVNTNSCTPCAAGYATNSTGQAACTSCSAGNYANGTGNATCTQCAAGYATNSTGQAACTSCSAGYYANGLGNTVCTSCSAGNYSPAGAGSCTQCGAGNYSGAGAASCTQCGAGNYSPAGAGSCTQCGAGNYSPAGAGSCTQCTAGNYSGAGAASCTQCGAGKYSGAGAGSCTNCPAGSSSGAGASSCAVCPSGQIAASSGNTCTACPAGSTSSVNHQACNAIATSLQIIGYNFQSITFTSTTSGNIPPTSAQVSTSTSGSAPNYGVSSGIIRWIVPVSRNYTFNLTGGGGGGGVSYSGYNAQNITMSMYIAANTPVYMIIGHGGQAGTTAFTSGGGGGGTFVFVTNGTSTNQSPPLNLSSNVVAVIAAAGGRGGYNTSGIIGYTSASLVTNTTFTNTTMNTVINKYQTSATNCSATTANGGYTGTAGGIYGLNCGAFGNFTNGSFSGSSGYSGGWGGFGGGAGGNSDTYGGGPAAGLCAQPPIVSQKINGGTTEILALSGYGFPMSGVPSSGTTGYQGSATVTLVSSGTAGVAGATGSNGANGQIVIS